MSTSAGRHARSVLESLPGTLEPDGLVILKGGDTPRLGVSPVNGRGLAAIKRQVPSREFISRWQPRRPECLLSVLLVTMSLVAGFVVGSLRLLRTHQHLEHDRVPGVVNPREEEQQ